MKKIITLFTVSTFMIFNTHGQIKTALFLSSQPVSGTVFIGTDATSNLYYLEDNIFFKKNESQLWQYKNLSLGKITKVDLQNPLKILVFYEDFNAVILLDNQLNEIQKINFSNDNASILTSAIGVASQNNIWIFNSLSQKLGLYNWLNGDFKSITTPLQGVFKHYESDFNTFQWIDEKLNWYSCTIFGQISFLKKVPDFDKIQIINSDLILFSKDKHLYAKDFILNRTFEIQNVDKSIDYFFYKDQNLSIFTNRQIKNYKMTLP